MNNTYGGHKEVIDNNEKHVVSNTSKIVLSVLHYTGKIWPKILRTKLSDHVSIETRARDVVR